MAKDTKEKLLEAALEMFSQNGYAGTNIRELSASLGLGKSSLYRHFESKEEVWNDLIDSLESYYEARFGSTDNLPAIPESTDGLREMTLRMLDFTVNDKKIIMTRRLLLTEQFRDERAAKLATKLTLIILKNIVSIPYLSYFSIILLICSISSSDNF